MTTILGFRGFFTRNRVIPDEFQAFVDILRLVLVEFTVEGQSFEFSRHNASP